MPSCAPSWRREGQEFETETDTETVAQLVDLHLARGMAPVRGGAGRVRRGWKAPMRWRWSSPAIPS